MLFPWNVTFYLFSRLLWTCMLYLILMFSNFFYICLVSPMHATCLAHLWLKFIYVNVNHQDSKACPRVAGEWDCLQACWVFRSAFDMESRIWRAVNPLGVGYKAIKLPLLKNVAGKQRKACTKLDSSVWLEPSIIRIIILKFILKKLRMKLFGFSCLGTWCRSGVVWTGQ